MEWFRGIPERVITAVTSLIARMRTWARQVITAARTTLRERWAAVMAWFRNLPGRIITAVTSAIRRMRTWGRQIISAAYTAIRERYQDVRTWFRGLGDRIRNAIPNPLTMLYQTGRRIITGLRDGITSMVGSVTSAVGGVLSAARGMFPSSPAKEGPFSGRGWTLYSGRAIVDALAKGMMGQVRLVRSAALAVAEAGQVDMDSLRLNRPLPPGLSMLAEGVPASRRAVTPSQVERVAGRDTTGEGMKVTQNIYTMDPQRAAADAVRKLRDAAYLGQGFPTRMFDQEDDLVSA